MVSSARQTIACILIIFGTTIFIQSQTVFTKGPTATIAGKVMVKGKGLPGIVVGLRLVESSSQRSTRHKTVTDEQGNYRLSNVPPGTYQVLAVAPAFILSNEQRNGKTLVITKEETIENIDFTLIRGGVVTGKVTDSEGRPLIEEGVGLYPIQQMNPAEYYSAQGVRTDDRGIYRIFGVPPGRYRIAAGQGTSGTFGRGGSAYKQIFYPAAADISQAEIVEVTEGSETTDIDITLGRPLVKYSVRGRIVDGETGRPLANVPYGLQTFISEHSTSSMSTGAVSNNEGEFKFDNVTPGKYAVIIDRRADSDWRADLARFEVIDRDVTGVLVKTSKGGSVSGVVVLEGTDDKAAHAAAKRLELYAYVINESVDNYNSGQSAIVNQDGTFRIGGLPTGMLGFSFSDEERFRVVRIERDGIVYPKGIEIKESEQIAGVRVIINYANGTIRGLVKLENGTLPQNAVIYVSLRRLNESASPLMSGFNENMHADVRGQFFKAGLLPGMYEVTGAVYIRDARTAPPQAKQQVVVVDGVVTDVTLTVNLDSTSGRP